MDATYKTDFTLKGVMKLNLLSLRSVGLLPPNDQHYRDNIPYFMFFILMQPLWHWSQTLLLAAYAATVEKEIETIANIIFMLPNYIVACMKTYYIAKYMDVILDFWQMSMLKVMVPRTQKEADITNHRFKEFKVLHGIYMLSAVFTDFALSLAPLLDHTSAQGKLVLDNWFPFNTNVSVVYESIYVYQAGSVFISGISNINVDSLIGGLMLYVAAQCEILCYRLENLDKYANEDEEILGGTLQATMKKSLIDCIEHHKLIVSFSSKIEKVISIFFTAQLFASFLAICGTVFQIAVIKQQAGLASLVCYNVAISFQLFIYCWFGDRIIEKSALIPTAAYSCLWYNDSNEVKKLLTFFIMRTREPIDVKTLGFFQLSIEVFVQIYKSAFSYATVLKRFNDDE